MENRLQYHYAQAKAEFVKLQKIKIFNSNSISTNSTSNLLSALKSYFWDSKYQSYNYTIYS